MELRGLLWVCVAMLWYVALVTSSLETERPKCPPGASPDRCREDGSAFDEHFYYINGKKLTIQYGIEYFYLTCMESAPLGSEDLPRFERTVEVPRVKLTGCAPPTNGYAAALQQLNVTVRFTLELAAVPAQPPLSATHLNDLSVAAFVLSGSPASPLRPDPGFLEPLTLLRDLRLSEVTLAPETALLFPATLRSIILNAIALETLPAEVFARLPLLTRLVIRDLKLQKIDVSMALLLGNVHVTAPLEGVGLGPSVVNLTLGSVRSAELRGDCSALKNVRVENVTNALPEGWVAHCSSVESVAVARVGAGRVGASELSGARSLRSLEVQRCGLRTLPARWLTDAPNLRNLDLSHNDLEELSSDIMTALPQLEHLDVSSNKLRPAVLGNLAGLPRLRELVLDRNPLGDLCTGSSDTFFTNALSALWRAKALRTLRLSRVGLTRLCRDWRDHLLNLTTIDLRYNGIQVLEFADLQWKREQGAEHTNVDLRGNPITNVMYSKEEYTAALKLTDQGDEQTTTLMLDQSLRCDCNDYWYARALRQRPRHAARLDTARCFDRRSLSDMPLEELLCDVPDSMCPRGCTCRTSGATSELRCEGAGLRSVPRVLEQLLPPHALLLARNNISTIELADVSPHLQLLDLSNNLISSIDAAIARVLVNTTLRLAGNPLRCACDTLVSLRTLTTLPDALLPDVTKLTCYPKGNLVLDAVSQLETVCVPALWPPLLAVAALLTASAAVAVCLTRPVARQRIKMFLFSRGLCLRWVLRETRGVQAKETGRDRDAFLSFSQHDWRYAEQLQQHLEPKRQLLVHHRDWTPGELIPAQIQASVRRSRRTIVLLSEHFLASTWARAEMREAYAAALRDSTPRLLLLVLPGLQVSRAAKEDEHLRAYLAAVTYLHWEDPDFWRKLDLALPPPLPPPSPSPLEPPAPLAPAAPA